MGSKRADLGPERADLGPKRADLGPDRVDLRPKRGLSSLRGGDVRTYGRTDVWKFTPVSYRTSALWGRCPALTPLLQLITPSRPSGTADHVRSLDD